MSLFVRSQADGPVTYSFAGGGTIRSGQLVGGASVTYESKKPAILQYRIGSGDEREKGVLPLEEGKVTEVLVTGKAAPAAPDTPPVPPSSPSLSYQPGSDGMVRIRHPFGPAFEKLDVAQQIKMVEESPKTAELSASDKNQLLGLLYNQKGVQEAERKLFRDAEASLLSARKYLPDQERIVRNLAFVIAADANEKRLEGRLSEGETRFRESLRFLEETPDPALESQIRKALASLYVEEAKELSDTNERGKENLLRKALAEDPTQLFALYQLGQMAYAEYDLQEALEFFEGTYRVSPQKELAELIQKVRAEIEEAGDFVTEERGDFKISFEGREVGYVARETQDLLRDAVREVGRKLGLRPNGTIPVVIYSGGQFQQILGLHSWAGGAYDGKIRLPLSDLSDQDFRNGRERVRRLVYHEYTHALLHNRAPRAAIPVWYHEGLAQLVSGETPGDGNLYRQMASAVTSGVIPLPSKMSGEFASIANTNLARQVYMASYSFSRYLLDEWGGWSRIRKTVSEIVSGKPFEEALSKTYRRSLEELESGWMQGLQRRSASVY